MATLQFCNICAQSSSKERPNLCLTCGHILCKSCVKVTGENSAKCSICSKTSGYKELDKLPESLRKSFFMNDLSTVFDEAKKVAEFQLQQEENTCGNISKYKKGCKKMKKLLKEEEAKARQAQAEYEKYRKIRVQMQGKIAQMLKHENEKKAKPSSQQYCDINDTSFETICSVSTSSRPSSTSEDSSFSFTPGMNENYFPNMNAAGPSGMNRTRGSSNVSTSSSDFTPKRRDSTSSSRSPFSA